jgi:hypothetical protein
VPTLQQLYETADMPPLWSRGGVPTAPVRAMVGLDPRDDDDAAYLDSLVTAPLITTDARAAFDAAMNTRIP